VLAAPHPYRIPDRGIVQQEPLDPCLAAQWRTAMSFVAWSLIRVGVCSVSGLDIEGCAALVGAVAATSWLANIIR
jgi:hypothetical protein